MELFNRLNGIFSFAIWDNEKKRLVIARDHYGVKPLYYAQNEYGFYFSSEIKSILIVDSIKKNINFDSLFRTLIFLWNPGEETLLSEIKKLKPAHYAIIENGVLIEYKSYWEWPEYKISPQSELILQQEIFDALENAVKDQLICDVPIGTFLSGGLDSSFITALAKKNSHAEIHSFTIDSNSYGKDLDGFSDDLPFAKQVSHFLKVNLHIVETAPNIINMLSKMIYHLDELQADPAPLNVLLIAELAKKMNIKVLLSGAGGDDIFTGYRRHLAISLEKYWVWMPQYLRRLLKLSTKLLPKQIPLCRRIAKTFQYADQSTHERLLSYFFWLDPKTAFELFNDEVKSKISQSPLKFLFDDIHQIKTSDPVEKMLYLERKYFLADHNLNYTDKMSMATGIEVRVPFLDQRVINTASKISSHLKQKGKIGKSILKKSAEKILPKNIIYRSKTGFGAPIRSWLKTDLAPMVDQFLSPDTLNKRGIFNPAKIKQIIELDRKNKQDYSYPIFALLCFEIWCQQFLD